MTLPRILRHTFLTTLLAVLLAACGNFGVLPLDEQVAGELATTATTGDELLAAMLTSPTSFSPQQNATLAAPLRALAGTLAPEAIDCFQDVSVSADGDGDGIPASASYLIDCTVSDGQSSATITISGSSSVSDDDDTDPISGYDVTVTDFALDAIDAQGSSYQLRFDLDYDLDKLTDRYVLDHDMSMSVTAPTGSASLTVSGMPGYTPDDWADPFVAGTFTFDGSLMFNRNGASYSLTRTSNGLHFDQACVSTFDLGSVSYTDGNGNSLVISYNACNDVTVTYNGTVVTN